VVTLPVAAMPEGLTCQVIDGDLSGNVLFASGQVPAVIDFVPYWRPAGFSLAIVVADAVSWFGAEPALALRLLEQGRLVLLARAALCRLVTSDVAALSMSASIVERYLTQNAQDYARLLSVVRRGI